MSLLHCVNIIPPCQSFSVALLWMKDNRWAVRSIDNRWAIQRERERERDVCWLLNVPATCECISGTDLLNFTCCKPEIEVADQTFHLTRSQYTDTGPTSPSTDPITPGAWQGSHWSANFEVAGMTQPRKTPGASGIRTRDLPLSRWTP